MGVKTMKMQKFVDWFNTNQECSRQEFVKNFKKLGFSECAKFTSWACRNQEEPSSKMLMAVLATPATTHPEHWE